MCGIVAVVGPPAADLRHTVEAMNEALHHRGPDEGGCDAFEPSGAAVAMRRLSIVDLAGGHQPMWDDGQRHCIVFNGEIYNAAALRRELVAAGRRFATDHSDTEVIINGFAEWGTAVFERLNGMFALAIWDREREVLTVARDRMGQKPLYIAALPGGYAVASELKALHQHPDFRPGIDPVALEQYLAFDYVLSPRTIYAGVSKLPPGHFAELTRDSLREERYWTPRFDPSEAGEYALLRRFDDELARSVQSRMIADVPIGLFLSGGLDSTAIGHYMRRFSDDVHSFSIGFEDPRYDESEYARTASEHLGTRHHLEVFGERRILDLVPRIPDVLDEPMGDPSTLPTYLLSQFTRRHVTVALGGDGSDELLMGYATYPHLRQLWSLDRLPAIGRAAVTGLARHVLSRTPARGRARMFADQLPRTPERRLLGMLGAFDGRARGVLAPDVRAGLDGEPGAGFITNVPAEADPASRTIGAYMAGYLSEDILVKVDRASMACSLEVRSPFLDPELVAFLGTVPPSFKLRGQTRKYLLRRLMRDRVPRPILERRKQGFGLPLDDWLRGALLPLMSEYLAPERLASGGLLDAPAVAQLVEAHRTGTRNFGHQLWVLLQLELWRERWLN